MVKSKLDGLILALDISTSITGFAVMNRKCEIVDFGNIDFRIHNKDVFLKLDQFQSWLSTFELRDSIEWIIIESPLRRFRIGQSSATTLFTLYSFNIAIQYILYKYYAKKPNMINAVTARKNLGITVPHGLKSSERKTIILKYVQQQFPELKWEYTKFGNPKIGSFDIADAVVLAESYCRKKF